MWNDYFKWHKKKFKINSSIKRPYFHDREIWFCNLGLNVGFEQNGDIDNYLRPVIIFRKFNSKIFWGIALTRTQKQSKYYYSFEFKGNSSTAILSQVRLIDSKRLNHKIGIISENDFCKIKQKLKALIP